MLEDERQRDVNQKSRFFEILLSIIKFFPNLTLELWQKIKKVFGIKASEQDGENLYYKNKILEDKETYYNKFKDNYQDNKVNNDYFIEIKSQTQMQASKQKLKQLESQTYSNRTMARLISTAELYALSVNCDNNQMYKKFDEFDNLNRKTRDELKGELLLQIECFKVSYQSYTKKYKKYDFPDDYDEEKTLEELKNIEQNINENDKKYYQAIIKLLNGDTNIPSFEDELDELEEGEPDTKDPILQIQTDIPIMRHLDGIRKNLKQNYLDDPMNCKIRLNLDEPMKKNEELEKLVKKLDKDKMNKKVEKKNRSLSAKSFNHKAKENEIENENNHFGRNRSFKLSSRNIFILKFEDEDKKEKEEDNIYDDCHSDCSSHNSEYEDLK